MSGFFKKIFKMIESKVTEAILQEPKVINISGKEYEVAPPSTATLLLMSKEISVLPKKKLDENNVFQEVFKNVAYGERICRSLAIMVLGAKKIREARSKKSFLSRMLNKEDVLDKLTQEILDCEISYLFKEYLSVISTMQVQDFFMLITFLTEINLTKPTKKVIETTASGR